MTDTDRKILTEFLGECYHIYNGTAWVCQNAGCHAHSDKNPNRTFTTPDGFFSLKNKLVEKGMWEKFWAWVWDDVYPPDDFKSVMMSGESVLRLLEYGSNPIRFPELVVEFLKK